ncbi:MAG: aldo/keto reductase [Kiritimatiellae bacterium]|nr:aldo/keto reductase [Kiritimatiellia bacterium]
MQYRKLGKTDMDVSAVCLGCWALIGGFNWGPQDERDSVAAIKAALELGITFLDTAPMYGNGASEELLGKVLGADRDRVTIATKVGSADLAPDALMRSCEDSLRRLKTDRIDLLQVHWPSRAVPFEDTLRALQALRAAGKVRAVGVSNFGTRDLSAMLAVGRVETNQLAYSLLWRAIEFEVQPLCVEHAVGILCYSSLAQGLLTGKFNSAEDVPADRARTRLFSKERPSARHDEPGCEAATFAAIDRIRAVCAQLGQPMSAVALAWLLARPAVTSVIAGARNAEQVRQNAEAAQLELPAELVAELDAATDPVKTHIGANADMWQSGAKSRIR